MAKGNSKTGKVPINEIKTASVKRPGKPALPKKVYGASKRV